MDALKILMVDDEERMRKLVKDFLTNKGFSVVEAGDGEEALEIFFCPERHCADLTGCDDAEDGWMGSVENHSPSFKSADHHADGQRRGTGRASGI